MTLQERYVRAMHALQSAIATIMYSGKPAAREKAERFRSPKHLRVGLDARAADHCALARMLINKGIFTEEEYMEAMVKSMEEEAERAAKEAIELCGLPPKTEFN